MGGGGVIKILKASFEAFGIFAATNGENFPLVRSDLEREMSGPVSSSYDDCEDRQAGRQAELS